MSGRDAADTREPSLPGVLAAGAVLLAFAVVDPVFGLGGGILVAACLAVLGPLPAFAVGQLVLAGLVPQPLVVLATLQAALVVLLLQPTLDAAAPDRLVAAGAGALGTAGLVAVAAWLWTGSVAVVTLASFGALGLLLYAVYRYEGVVVGTPAAA
jgi:hypothetical protein